MGYPEPCTSFSCGDGLALPQPLALIPFRTMLHRLRPKPLPTSLCCRDAFGLPLTDKSPLRFCHIRQQLKDDVRDEGACEVAGIAGIQQGAYR